MKVRELIEGSVFTPGPGRDSDVAPRVTIILPTFRRGDSGMLGRAIESIRRQSYADFELIVVDDASVDSSAEVIAEAMRADPRISVIRHARNIGLPAVSEYEAYRLARGELISFAFDDTVFRRHALRRLVAESDRHPDELIAGYVTAYYRTDDGELHSEPVGKGVTEADLLATNVIPNNAVLAPRRILEVVGLYDPHISLARLCDYDLWVRVRRRFPIRFLDRLIGEEHGPSTTDSLGSTYPLDHWTTDDRMRQERDESLRPENFGEIDVFETEPFLSERSRSTVQQLAEGHRATRSWMTPPSGPRTPAQRVPRIAVIAPGIDASVQLCFQGLRDVEQLHVRLVDPTRRTVGELAPADVLIVSRHLGGPAADWIAAARVMGIPAHYYLDDNLPLMAEEGELDEGLTDEFGADALRRRLSGFAGVLTSSEPLAEGFRSLGLHASVTALPLIAPRLPAVSRPPRGATRTFALLVGPHRLAELGSLVIPALVEAVRDAGRPARLLVPAGPAVGEPLGTPAAGVEVVEFAANPDYFGAVRDLTLAGTDVLVVPDARTANAPFKTEHPVLTAALLESAVLVPPVTPYTNLRDVQGVTVVRSSWKRADWRSAFAALLREPSTTRVPQSLRETRFSARVGAERLLAVVDDPATPLPDLAQRLHRLANHQSRQVALLRHSASVSALPALAALAAGEAPTDLQRFLGRSRSRIAVPAWITRRSLGQRLATVGAGRERLAVSAPLAGIPFLAYPMELAAGDYAGVHAVVWSDGEPGDLFGVEVVDPQGRIVLHTIAALPRHGLPIEVALDASALRVDADGVHQVRVFTRTTRLAFLLESHRTPPRRRSRDAEPDVRPLVRFERAPASPSPLDEPA